MRSRFMTVLAVIGGATVLVLAANTVALATTGKALIAGKTNTSSKVTTIKRTKAGPAVKATTKTSADAPFAVNGKGKVTNLNVDKVDGLDGGTQAYRWIATGDMGGSKTYGLNSLPNGNYLITWEAYLFGSVDAGASGDCYIAVNEKNSGNYRYTAEASTLRNFWSGAPVTGTGFLSKTPSDIVSLTCRVSSGTVTIDPRQPIRVTAIPLAGVTAKSVGKVLGRTR